MAQRDLSKLTGVPAGELDPKKYTAGRHPEFPTGQLPPKEGDEKIAPRFKLQAA
jgi:hypothetical protein